MYIRRILKEKYNINVTSLALVVLHPDNYNENYEVIDVPLLDDDLDLLWDYRRKQLVK